jgi:hypothetical protein
MSFALSVIARESLAAVNRLAAPIDRIARARKPASRTPILIAGLPRSGTTLAYELLVQGLDVAYLTRLYSYTFGIPNLTTRVIARVARNHRPRYESDYGRIPGILAPTENAVLWRSWFPERPELGHYVVPPMITDEAVTKARTTIASISTIAGRPFVFKNVYLTLSLAAVMQSLPELKVIVIARDTAAVTASVLKRRLELASSEWWSIKPPLFDSVAGEDIAAQTAFQCVRSNQLLERALAQAPANRCMLVDYETVCQSPVDFVSNVARWAGDDVSLSECTGIPDSFEARPSVGYPPHLAARIEQHIDALQQDRDEYLRAVDGRVAELAEGEK